ncbi:glycosyltransferase, partial [Turicibacter sanguinis]|nr:glycosyltransferase [Turicibacter sanguinis]
MEKNKKIKVLHIIGSLKIGGAENIAMNFSRFINREKFQIDYLVFGEEIGEYEEEAKKLGCRVLRLAGPNEGYLNFYKNLKKILKVEKYDVVHSHTLLNNGIIMKAAHSARIRVRISHSHSTNSGRKEEGIYKLYKTIMFNCIKKYSTHYLACGLEAGNFLFGKVLFEKEGILINNGIPIEEYIFSTEKRKSIRSQLKIEDELIIGHIGRMAPVKNHLFLIKIFAELNKIESNSKLLIIGDGEIKTEIVQRVKEMNLQDKVIFLGIRRDISNLLQAMDVFVFPSLYEGFPLTLLEAQASSLQCLVADTISSEVKLTNSLTFASLCDSEIIWAKKILSKMNNNRVDNSQILIEKGFDIKS